MVSVGYGWGRRLVAVARLSCVSVCIVATALEPLAVAAPARPNMAAVDAGMRRGQDEYNRGEYSAAAHAWIDAAELMPETPEHRDNRAAIYEYAADAFVKAIEARGEAVVAAELVTVLSALDKYAEAHATAYPGQSLPSTVVKAQVYVRGKLAALDKARRPAPESPQPLPEPERSKPAPPAPSKPWKGLAIGGGVALGAGVTMAVLFGASLVQMNRYEDGFNHPNHACDPNALEGICADYHRRATNLDRAATIGIISAPVFLAAGATLLALGLRRKSKPARYGIAPTFSPRSAGAVLRFAF
ncbi:hypothetical protein [Nannocystis punicea]|uniref:Uncharacterized protein n=1 Tax=Nannocystis punicea TaxID=2995304 RepID=A0ABY7H258_9BACT|nr:hypothetical protein [Nannocystis poenicansa]WAS93200.1 hypothetical protein O0S08_44115 [Nannocystis poenicansa]